MRNRLCDHYYKFINDCSDISNCFFFFKKIWFDLIWNNSNNFYFYFDAAGKFYFIPYDYDNTLGTSLLMTDSGIQNPLTWGKSDQNPLVYKVLSIPEYKTQYFE